MLYVKSLFSMLYIENSYYTGYIQNLISIFMSNKTILYYKFKLLTNVNVIFCKILDFSMILIVMSRCEFSLIVTHSLSFCSNKNYRYQLQPMLISQN